MGRRRIWLRRGGVGAISALTAAAGALALAPSAFAGTVQPHTTTGTTVTTTPTTPPTIQAGATNQAAGTLNISLPNTFVNGDTLTFVASVGAQANCSVPNGTIGFSATPTVKVSGGATGETAPTVTAALSPKEAVCTTAKVNDELTLTIGNSATTVTTPTPWTITVSGIAYDVGSAAPAAAVNLAIASNDGTPTTTTISNATVSTAPVASVTPVVGVQPSATAAPISNFVITETASGVHVTAGEVCVVLSAGTFDSSSTPAVSASGGGAAASSASVSGNTAKFDITTPGSTGPATYTLSGLKVDSTATTGPVTGAVTYGGTAPACGASTLNSPRVFSVVASSRAYGQNAPGTAAAQFEKAYSYGTGACPGGAVPQTNRPAVLARYDLFPDALSGSYVAGRLGTGILLTNTSTLSSESATALRLEGITTVYVMGGPLAVSDAVVTQLEGTPSYHCGGTTVRTNTLTGATIDLKVVRIAGTDRYGTSEAAAEYFGASGIGTPSINGAYAAGMYNNTTGNASTAGPAGTAGTTPTAIVSTGQNFRDAVSSSVVADSQKLPMILTTQASLSSEASAALTADHIGQVIVLGGPLAVSNAVVTSIQNMGISVLRIAGADGTDTAQLLAQFELNSNTSATAPTGPEGLAWAPNNGATKANNVALARGDFYPDALAGSALAAAHASNPEPILLTESPTSLGTYTTSFLNTGGEVYSTANNGIDNLNTSTANNGEVVGIDVFGGPLAVSSTTQQDALNAVAQG